MRNPLRISIPLTRRALFVGAVGTSAAVTVPRRPQSQVTPAALASSRIRRLHRAVDFAIQTTAFPLHRTGTIGRGVGSTIYRIRPFTSTKAALVHGLVPYQTNQFTVMRWFTYPSWFATRPEIAHFTLQGTKQGHAYNGMQVGYSNGAHVHDLRITGIPGVSSSPPGETFSLSLWHADHALVERVICDGRRGGAGTVGIAATLFGQNYVRNPTFRRCTAKYAHTGYGSASYECVGETWEDCTFAHNRRHLNIERTFGGTFRYVRCHFHHATVPYVAQVSTDPAHGSAKVIFEDCTVDRDGILRVRVYGRSAVNSQRDSDIRCIRNGRDVTHDRSKFRLVRSG